jgi:hypothetical protein
VTEKSLLDLVYIAKPCDAQWDDMQGDNRVRFCATCSKNVYNTSDMTRNEAEFFLQENGVSACIGIFRREDGTVIVDDCPIGLRKARDAAKRMMRVCATFFGFLLSMLYLGPSQAQAVDSTDPLNESKSFGGKLPNGSLAGFGVPLGGTFCANSVHDACVRSDYIVIAEYQDYNKTERIDFARPPKAHFRLLKLLKGPVLPNDLLVRYAFYNGAANLMANDWVFFEELMPAKGSQFILCMNYFSKDGCETYNGSYGRFPLNAANLQAMEDEIRSERLYLSWPKEF